MPLSPPDVTSSAPAELPQQRLLADLQQLVRPRHARWDELGLMSVRSFVLEELHGSFTPVMFVAAFLASVTADVVSRFLVGESPVFHFIGLTTPGVASLPWAAVLGLAMGGVGSAGV